MKLDAVRRIIVSIHAPMKGATEMSGFLSYSRWFQSTLP